jgi:hypothetical protein
MWHASLKHTTDSILLRHPASFFQRFLPRELLLLSEDGFSLQRKSQAVTVNYRDIETLQLDEMDSYSNGISIGTLYNLRIKTANKQVEIKHLSLNQTSDEFPNFVSRLLEALATLAEEAIAQGRSLQGDGWKLSKEGLQVNGHKISWNQVADVDRIENKIMAWKDKDVYPALRVPASSKHARVLLEVLESYLKSHPHEDSPEGVGRFLFRRKADKFLFSLVSGISVLLMIIGIWMVITGAMLSGFLFLFLGGAVAAYAIYSMRHVFDFYQNGIIRRPGHNVLFFNRCLSIQYQVNLQYVNDVYAFTRILMKIKMMPDGRSITIRTQRYGNDPELEQAKLKISKEIAERLYLKVKLGEEVEWGRSVRLTKDELHYLSNQLLRSTVRTTVRLSIILSYAFEEGKFHLFRFSEEQPIFTMDCDEENFYPGFMLFLRLAAEAS